MARLTEAMKKMIASHLCYIATADKNGRPNVGPKRSTRILDDSTLIFNEATGRKTYENILGNPYVSIAVVDREALDGYQLSGTAEILTSGEVYDQVANQMTRANMPKPKAVIKVTLEDIYSLKPGQAGNRFD